MTSQSFDYINSLETVLTKAEYDDAVLEDNVAQLDSKRITTDLKTALRNRYDIEAEDTPHIGSLRRRYEQLHALLNKKQSLIDQMQQTVIDVETFAAELMDIEEPQVVSSSATLVEYLQQDVAALREAHEEVNRLSQENQP